MVWAMRGSARTAATSGASVTTRLGWRHPDSLAGIHLAAVSFPEPPPPWSPAERQYQAAVARWDEAEGAYSHVQSTKPATLAMALNDSPAGLAAWIIEKFRAWSDCNGDVETHFGRDQLLTNLTIYWATQTIGVLGAALLRASSLWWPRPTSSRGLVWPGSPNLLQ